MSGSLMLHQCPCDGIVRLQRRVRHRGRRLRPPLSVVSPMPPQPNSIPASTLARVVVPQGMAAHLGHP
jgi:hypothetical protein